jgi:Uma2 family endonuclease
MAAVLDRPATATVKFSLAHYHHLIALGLLADHRVELLEGEIVRMAPMKAPHLGRLGFLTAHLPHLITPDQQVYFQSPITLSTSEPEPDVMILKASPTFYGDSKPTAIHALLLIEISDTTLNYDQGRKLAIYAESGIPEYWIIDLDHDVIHQYSDPQPATRTYGTYKLLQRGDTLRSVHLPAVTFGVSDILGV